MNIRLPKSVARFLVFAVLSGMGLTSVNPVYAGASEVLSGSRAASLERCVIPDTADMRRNHMELLFHKRDQTMRQGIRTHGDNEVSLNGCVDCHVAKDDKGQYIPVDDERQFCQSCHKRVAVRLDCFDCHRTTPETN